MLISGKFCNWSYLTSEENKKKNGKDEGLFWNALWLAWLILRLACLWPASSIMVMIFSHPCLRAAASKHSHSSICSKLSGISSQTQHPGFYYQQAANNAIVRRQLCQGLCHVSSVGFIQVMLFVPSNQDMVSTASCLQNRSIQFMYMYCLILYFFMVFLFCLMNNKLPVTFNWHFKLKGQNWTSHTGIE